MQIFDDLRVDNNTHITVKGQEIALEDVHKHSGYWLCGFDRDGSCFEMCKQDADSFIVRDIRQDVEVEVADYYLEDSIYYWSENYCDSGILYIK